MRELIGMAVVALGCGSKAPPPLTTEPPPPPMVDAAVVAPVDAAAAVTTPPPAPDPLAGKSAEEQWVWAQTQLPSLGEAVRRPAAADFTALGIKGGKITLYTPHLELTLAQKQLKPCAPVALELDGNGELATRIATNGSSARPDLKDRYVVFRLGVTIFDHESVAADGANGVYADSSIGGVLSEVSARGLRYEGSGEFLVVKCRRQRTTHECRDGSTMVCERCTPALMDGRATIGAVGQVSKGSACEPCPPDPGAALIEPLARVLKTHPVMRVDEGSGPTFYTRLADCKAALRAKPKAHPD